MFYGCLLLQTLPVSLFESWCPSQHLWVFISAFFLLWWSCLHLFRLWSWKTLAAGWCDSALGFYATSLGSPTSCTFPLISFRLHSNYMWTPNSVVDGPCCFLVFLFHSWHYAGAFQEKKGEQREAIVVRDQWLTWVKTKVVAALGSEGLALMACL